MYASVSTILPVHRMPGEQHIQQLADAGQKRPWELPARTTNGRDALSVALALSRSLSPSL